MASSCQPATPTTWPIADVVVDGLASANEARLAQVALSDWLRHAPGVVIAPADPSAPGARDEAALRLRVTVAPALLPATGSEGVLMQVEVGAHQGTGRQFASTIALHDAGADMRSLREGFGRAWEQVVRQRQLDDAGELALVAAVEVKNATLGPWNPATPQSLKHVSRAEDADDVLLARAGRVAFALRRIAERRVRKAAPEVSAWLERADQPDATAADRAVALHAVGTLVALGDPQAVAPMIALAQHKEPAFVLQLAYAVSALGGPLAEGYLVTLGSGHPDDMVREGAAAALDELLARKADSVGESI